MSRSVFNFPPKLIRYIMEQANCSAPKAHCLANIYGHFEWCEQNNVAKESVTKLCNYYGYDRKSCQRYVQTMEEMGWIKRLNFEKNNGAEFRLMGIPYGTLEIEELDFDASKIPMGQKSMGQNSPSDASKIPSAMRQNSPSDASKIPNTKELSKNSIKELIKEQTPGSFLDLPSVNQENLPPSKPTKSKLDKELLSLINEHIPQKWPRLTVLTASRKKVLETIWSGNGGRSWFIEKFPIVMQAVKVDEFWSGTKADYGKFRPPSFDGFFGSNTKTPKDHFVRFLERGTEITTKEQVLLTKRALWHPHFAPPVLRPYENELYDTDCEEWGFRDRGEQLMERLDNPAPDDQHWQQYKDAVIYYSEHPDGIKARN